MVPNPAPLVQNRTVALGLPTERLLRRVAGSDCPVHIGYIDPDGREVSPDGFAMVPTYSPPAETGE